MYLRDILEMPRHDGARGWPAPAQGTKKTMETVLSILAGAVVTWFFAWLYYAKAGRELKEEVANLRDLIAGPLNSLLEKEGETQLLLKRAFDELEKVNPQEARSLGEAISTHQSDVAQVVQRIEKAVSGLNSTPVEATTSCYQCGKPAYPAGFSGGPGGGWVMWYQCPEHGRFAGNHVDDMYDD
jgi:hypothetical protein